MTIGRAAAIVVFALVGWTLCAASIGIGFAVTTQTVALIAHAMVAPVVFAGLSWIYFTRFAYTTPLVTAALFLGIVVALDLVVVAAFVVRSFAMFGSVLGTWLPFALIFAATWATGHRRRPAAPNGTSLRCYVISPDFSVSPRARIHP